MIVRIQVPDELQASFVDIADVAQHPVVVLSW